MKTDHGRRDFGRALLLAAVVVVVSAAGCRSGAQVPKNVALPVIEATVSSDICLNDSYPQSAPQMGDNSAISYTLRPSGLKVFDHATGSGGTPSPTSIVTARYTGWLEDGCIFDSSYVRGEPAEFLLEQLIPGWAEGLSSMQAGGRRRLEVPPQLAYGPVGFPGVIPGNASLVFEIELLSFAEPTPVPEATPAETPTP